MARFAEFEMVSYRTSDIEQASYVFLQRFTQFSGICGTGTLITYFEGLRKIIKEQKPKPYKLSAPEVDVYFSGFTPPIPRVKSGKLIFEATEPGFAVLPNNNGGFSGRRIHMQKVADEVMKDMGKNYHMDVHKNPSFVTFPKHIYGKVEVFNAAFLS